jgi:hypothetical protein
MLINDVKKGMKIRTKDGITGTMMDNQKGIIRTIQIPMIFDSRQMDIGSCYVDTIRWVMVKNEWEKVELSEANRKQLSKIPSSFR